GYRAGGGGRPGAALSPSLRALSPPVASFSPSGTLSPAFLKVGRTLDGRDRLAPALGEGGSRLFPAGVLPAPETTSPAQPPGKLPGSGAGEGRTRPRGARSYLILAS